MKALKVSAVILAAGLATGCASTSDIDNLQAQIDGLNTQITTASSAASTAQAAAT